MKKFGEAVDEVRRAEAKDRPLLLKKTRWLWLTNRANLSPSQQRKLVWLTRPSVQLATARAHRWREHFQGFYDQPADQADAYLTRWCAAAMRSRLQPIKDFVAMVKRHWDGILAWPAATSPPACSKGSTPSSRPPRPALVATATSST
jgi:transposase